MRICITTTIATALIIATFTTAAVDSTATATAGVTTVVESSTPSLINLLGRYARDAAVVEIVPLLRLQVFDVGVVVTT